MLSMYFIEETTKAQEYQFPKATQPVTVIELEFKLVSDIPQKRTVTSPKQAFLPLDQLKDREPLKDN